MPQWGPFLLVAVALAVLLLFLARQSEQLIRAHSSPGVEGPDSAGLRATDADSGDERRGSVAEAVGPKAGSVGSGATPTEQGGTDVPALTSATLLANVMLTQSVLVVLVGVAAWQFGIPATALGLAGGPLVTGFPSVVVGVGFGLGLWLANEFVAVVADAAGLTYDERVRALLAPSTPRGWVVLFGVALPLIALAEELLFRAALVGVPAAGFDVSPWLLVVVSSVAFALGHGAQGRTGVLVTGGLGLALAAGFVLSGSLLLVVVAHYVINAMEFLVHELLGTTDLIPLATLPTRPD